jgi:drug/metabolite transporter (DMT)-like permease
MGRILQSGLMPKNNSLQHLFQLNFAVLLISTSGTLGRHIDLPVPVIIASRALIGGFALYCFCKWKKFSFIIKKEDRKVVFISGVLMGIHWITYFYSLKLSNVAIGMLSVFTYPVITSFLEPIILKSKFDKSNIFLGLLVLIGIYFLVPEFSFKNTHLKAIGFGVFSALCYSIRNVLMKAKVKAYEGSILMSYQLIVVSVLLIPTFFVYDTSGFQEALPAVLILSLLTTATGHTLFLYSFKNFSITAASIISSIQPVYGILIGMLVLKEFPEKTTIIGGLIILSSVVIESARTYRK